jgi:hypothetical protein
MTVNGQMALNPQTGTLQAFQRDAVGNVLRRRDPMQP